MRPLGCIAIVFLIAAFFAFLPPRHASVEAHRIKEKCPTFEVQCIKPFFTEMIGDRGLIGTFEMMNALFHNEPEFRKSCSALTLHIAQTVASTTNAFGLSRDVAACNYGFFQNYPRVLLLRGMPITDVRTFCMRVGEEIGSIVPDARAECFRGMGRGFPFVEHEFAGDTAVMAEYAVRACRKVSPDEAGYLNCLSGIFNALARESVAKTFDLEVRPEDPMWLCDVQRDSTVRDRCAGNWKWTAMSELNGGSLGTTPGITAGFTRFSAVRGTIPPQYAEEVLWALGYEEARANIGRGIDDSMAVAECASLPPRLRKPCIVGYAVGIAKNWIPWEQDSRMIAFCSAAVDSISDMTPQQCLATAVEYLQGFYSARETQRMCARIMSTFDLPCDELRGE